MGMGKMTKHTAKAPAVQKVTIVKKKRSKYNNTNGSKERVYIGRGLPKVMSMWFDYCEQYDFTTASGLIGAQVFKANSLYDPDHTGVGHQPMYLDQISAIYQRYRVTDFEIKVTFVNTSTTVPVRVCIYEDNDSTPPTDIDSDVERRRTKQRILDIAGSGKSQTTYKRKINISKVTGSPITQSDLQALVSADPSLKYYIGLMVQAVGTDTIGVSAYVHLSYKTEMYMKESTASS